LIVFVAHETLKYFVEVARLERIRLCRVNWTFVLVVENMTCSTRRCTYFLHILWILWNMTEPAEIQFEGRRQCQSVSSSTNHEYYKSKILSQLVSKRRPLQIP
jgi:hypothetical protein